MAKADDGGEVPRLRGLTAERLADVRDELLQPRGPDQLELARLEVEEFVAGSFLLLFFGWALYCIGPGKIELRFQNVLAQLAVTYIIAFLLMNKPAKWQIIVSFLLLAVTEVIYRTFPVEGFNHPFVANENFGTWLDMQYGGADLNVGSLCRPGPGRGKRGG